jgi:antitoxin component of MazEF toxin-antitoxin module
MPTLNERTVLDLGQGSYAVCLPRAWFRYYGLKPGDKVEVIANGEITIRPKQKQPAEK